MSIIFKKLTTLKNDSAGQEDLKQTGLQDGLRIYTFKSLVFSPRGALIIFASLFAFSLISFSALSILKDYLDSASNRAIVVKHKEVQPEITASAPGTDNAPGTEGPPGIEAEPGADTLPDESMTEEPAGFKVPEHFIRLLNKKEPDSSLIPRPGPDQEPEEIVAFIPKYLPEKSLPDRTSPSEVKIKTQLDALRTAKKQRTQKTSAISRLAGDLEQAIEKNDAVHTQILFNELVKESGQTSPYYIKLKAFKEIRDQNYEAAKKLLNQILDKDINDFDANYNMAVIEINEQKKAAAVQRLTRLKEIHPSRALIDDLLNSL